MFLFNFYINLITKPPNWLLDKYQVVEDYVDRPTASTKAHATREPKEVSQLPPTLKFAFEKSGFPCFPPYNVECQGLVPGIIELHLLCHVTLLYCQVRS